MIGPEANELLELIARVITVRGANNKALIPDWISGEVMRIIDPHLQAPISSGWRR